MSEIGERAVKQNQRRFVSLTNIPTPYRLHFYRTLSEELKTRGWTSDVWFMAKTESNRYWKLGELDFGFPHKFFRGISPSFRQTTFHMNPGVVARLWTDPPDILMVGQWMLPTNLLSVPIIRWQKHCRVLSWVESHQKSSEYKSRMLDFAKRKFFSQCDGFAVPGRFSREYMQAITPDKPTYSLPNIIDERLFRTNVLELRSKKESLRADLGVSLSKRVIVLPARLAVEKAVGPFLKCIVSLPERDLNGLTIFVAGDGLLRRSLTEWLLEHPQADIRLLGNLSEREMFRMYAVSDAMALPSFRDPNPLSVIEACWSELPLLLSSHVGNHPEALRPGENGWLFDPQNPESIVLALKSFLSATDRELKLMGSVSGHIAETCFRSELVVQNFLDDVIVN